RDRRHRGDDGGLAAGPPPDRGDLRGRAATVHRGNHADRYQGLSRGGEPMAPRISRRSVVLQLGIVAAAAAAVACGGAAAPTAAPAKPTEPPKPAAAPPTAAAAAPPTAAPAAPTAAVPAVTKPSTAGA